MILFLGGKNSHEMYRKEYLKVFQKLREREYTRERNTRFRYFTFCVEFYDWKRIIVESRNAVNVPELFRTCS